MKYRQLGRTDLRVSEIGFGAWAIGGSWGFQAESESLEALQRGFRGGRVLQAEQAGPVRAALGGLPPPRPGKGEIAVG